MGHLITKNIFDFPTPNSYPAGLEFKLDLSINPVMLRLQTVSTHTKSLLTIRVEPREKDEQFTVLLKW